MATTTTTTSEHRKIELQSPADLTYLTTQLRTAALQKLNLHLPPHPDDDNKDASTDSLRKNVESLIDAFVKQVISGMRKNVSINGVDLVSQDDDDADTDIAADVADTGMSDAGQKKQVEEIVEFSPYDEKLRAKLAATVAKRDALIAGISAHRRNNNTAKEAARRWEEQFLAASEADLMATTTTTATLQSREGGGDGGVETEMEMEMDMVGELKRQEEIERNWMRAVEGLGRLEGGLPETRARLERCGDVVEYLQGGGGGTQ